MKHTEETKRKISQALKGRKRSTEVRNKIRIGMQGKNVGEQNIKFKGHFWMLDLETGQMWRFGSTHQCEKFARKELNLTLAHSTVWGKLNRKNKIRLYQDRYKFIWCDEQSANKVGCFYFALEK